MQSVRVDVKCHSTAFRINASDGGAPVSLIRAKAVMYTGKVTKPKETDPFVYHFETEGRTTSACTFGDLRLLVEKVSCQIQSSLTCICNVLLSEVT